jgi:hypothetical protein
MPLLVVLSPQSMVAAKSDGVPPVLASVKVATLTAPVEAPSATLKGDPSDPEMAASLTVVSKFTFSN